MNPNDEHRARELPEWLQREIEVRQSQRRGETIARIAVGTITAALVAAAVWALTPLFG
ncbi:hypothetical protein [Croceicoccus sp. YJ47]|uniref:hypothetical protein n=1 Tax=Croceicoccus sp. YJ47 TaxID=2798724 RepID=UPI001924CB77|nr:hypothetical protein [Croceicoccus sp. YJ47]QQN75025.1 hypothetical protein JD971_04835 [Croceicoccus sp. YJ47]